MEQYELSDLKLIYRILHQQIRKNVDLMDSELFTDLQRQLQRHALDEGVDVSDHGQWDQWLGNDAVRCAARVRDRSTLEP